jgi:hypothetical protein
VVLPSLTALALVTDNEREISKLSDFLRNFSMGWRIFDDLCDWRKDLEIDNLNNSSILLYILQNIHGEQDLDEEIVLSMFLDHEFIRKVYGIILKFNNLAKMDVSAFDCAYLSKFMDEQISFHTKRRDSMLFHTHKLSSEFIKQLNNILNK